MRNKISFILAAAITTLSISMFAGCNNESETLNTTTTTPTTTTHTHSYTESIASEAACEADGTKTFTCACGDTYTEVIAKLGHDYNAVITAPTCTETGFTTHTCSRCNHSYTDTETAATGHNYDAGTITAEATCEADGSKTLTCTVCGISQTEVIAKLEHSYTPVVTAPTCTETGFTTHTCANCGGTYTDSKIAAIGHNYEPVADSAKKATCTKDGKEADTKCSLCGNTVAGTAISATGHSYETVADSSKKATCTKDGKEADTKCSLCGDIVSGKVISAAGHSYGEYVYNNDATQTADGTKSKTCKTCGKVSTTTAKGTKLPFDPYTLRAITSLDEIPVLGTLTDSDSSEFIQIGKDIEKGKYEKVRYIASNGEQFCLYNVRTKDTRGQKTYYYFYVAPPVASEFSDGRNSAKIMHSDAAAGDKYLINVGMNVSGVINECMLNRDESIPLAERTINTAECPVELYKIVDSGNMISVWVEGTSCFYAGIGTCGSRDCTGTCLRSKTLDTLYSLRLQKGWLGSYGGENGRINWNGTFLVNYYYLSH